MCISNFWSWLVVIFILGGCQISSAQSKKKVLVYQKELNQSYKDPSTSPLKEAAYSFEGLTFFDYNKQFRLKANFVPSSKNKIVNFETSTNRKAAYKKYGKLTFEVNGKSQTLTVFQGYPINPMNKNHLFVPFLDQTNGNSTYGGGRYLDLKITDISKNKVCLDFNKSYNPYCAYSDLYSCPIPPLENQLDVEVKAGVLMDK